MFRTLAGAQIGLFLTLQPPPSARLHGLKRVVPCILTLIKEGGIQMSHEILTVKLCQLDEKIGKLHSRIHLTEYAEHAQVKSEIAKIRKECEETEMMLHKNLRFSKAEMLAMLSDTFSEVEQVIGKAKEKMNKCVSEDENEELYPEEKILMAEYALDFAMLAADHALLMSLEAIDAQMEQQEK